QNGTPKVACPLHKKTFSLETGACLSGDDFRVSVFPVRVDGDDVYVQLPPAGDLARELATGHTCNKAQPPAALSRPGGRLPRPGARPAGAPDDPPADARPPDPAAADPDTSPP